MDTKEMDLFGTMDSKGMNSELASKVATGSVKNKGRNRTSYDKEFKSFFSRLDVLSGILRDTIPEFRYLSLSEVRTRLTEDPLRKGHALTLDTEDNFGGSQVKYDILVDVIFKKCDYGSKAEHKETVVLSFDLEMQQLYNKQYPMTNRAVYYSSRLLGRQSVKNSSYGKLKPVRTVWIFLNGIPEGFENSIVHIQLEAFNQFNELIDRSVFPGLDLIGIDYVFLSPSYDLTKIDTSTDPDLVKFLQSIFHSRAGEIAYNPYDIDVDIVKKEVIAMGNIDEDFQEDLMYLAEKMAEEKAEKMAEEKAEKMAEEKAAKVRSEGIEALILDNLEEGKDLETIKNKLMKRFNLSEKIALEYIDTFGK